MKHALRILIPLIIFVFFSFSLSNKGLKDGRRFHFEFTFFARISFNICERFLFDSRISAIGVRGIYAFVWMNEFPFDLEARKSRTTTAENERGKGSEKNKRVGIFYSMKNYYVYGILKKHRWVSFK